MQAYNTQACAMAEHTMTGHGYCWTQSGCSGSTCHVGSGGESVLTHHGCHPSSHTRPAHSRVTQPDPQPGSTLLLLTATPSMLLQLLFTGSYLAPPQTFPCRTFLLFLNFYSGIFLDGDAVRSFSSILYLSHALKTDGRKILGICLML